MHRPRTRVLLILLALVLVVGAIGAGTYLVTRDRPAQPDSARRILIVGDSITQGKAGDWTWRYRLWKTLEEQGADVDFVGPRTDLSDGHGGFGSKDYQDPDFDTDHASRWGMGYFDLDWKLGDLVKEYDPDVVVIMLGVNDFVWEDATAKTVLDDDVAAVQEIRSVDPSVDVVFGAIGQKWVDPEIPYYNVALYRQAALLNRPTSRVLVSAPPSDLQPGVDTYDLVHPSASGEVKIAAGVAEALARLGIGNKPTPAPTPS